MKLIRSRDNPAYRQLKKLVESGRARRECGQMVLDGVHLIEACEAAQGRAVDAVFVAESALAARGEVAALVEGRAVTILADGLMRELGIVETPTGILALASIPHPVATPDVAQASVLLDGVQDPGNVGTLLRTAAAAGYRQILLSSGCASVWSPKVLRAGQGAHFAVDLHEGVDLLDFVDRYRGTVAATCLEQAESLYAARWSAPLAWIFGAEGQGVRPALLARAGLRVRIPMPGAVESLNVAAAAAICLFETVRRAQPEV